MAQERLQQSSGGSAMGVGTGVGDISGSPNRVSAFDRNSFLDRLSQPETVYGRVLAIDFPAGKMHLETGGSSHDEGRAGAGSMNSLTVYFDDKTNMDQIKTLNHGDDISLQVFEATTATQQYGVGKKIVREVYLLRGNEKLAGFGGLGQRPNPGTERAIETNRCRWCGPSGQDLRCRGYHDRRIHRNGSVLELRTAAGLGLSDRRSGNQASEQV
jgi:hypothetical protein